MYIFLVFIFQNYYDSSKFIKTSVVCSANMRYVNIIMYNIDLGPSVFSIIHT